MNKDIKINNRSIIILIIAAFITAFTIKLELGVIGDIIPYTCWIVSFLIIFFTEKDLNKKAFIYLIPIIMVLASYFIIKLAPSNYLLNLAVIPILFAIFIYKLLNKKYEIGNGLIASLFNLFPKGLFSNTKYLQSEKNRDSGKIKNILLGLLIGFFVGSIFITLLSSADDYFLAFINNITDYFDLATLFVFGMSFIAMFSILVNSYLNRDKTFGSDKKESVNSVIVSTVLCVINFIFLLFLISEISRLTNNFLRLPVEYTYSSYAREGFFQLLAITVLNFAITAFLVYKTDVLKESGSVKKLLLLLISFSILLIINSYYRMYMYISSCGFTILRLQVVLFLLMELILFGLLIKKILKGIKHREGTICYVIMVIFYLLNIFLCNDWFINVLGFHACR